MIDWRLITDNREEGKTPEEQAKLVMIKLLRVFDAICREYHLTYWLSCGTLLGAIRHDGFIPWDDDIDVEMPRNDYQKFLRIASMVLPEDVFLQTRETDRASPILFAKLRDKYSTFVEHNFRCECHQGIFIDIFPIEYSRYPRCQKFLKLFLHRSCYGPSNRLENFIQRNIGRFLKKVIIYFRLPLYDWLNCLFRTSFDKATCYSFGMEIQELRTFPKDCLFPLQKHRFEGYEFYIPRDYDRLLTLFYGDYMKLPPIEQRDNHHEKIDPFQPCRHKEVMNWKNKLQ